MQSVRRLQRKIECSVFACASCGLLRRPAASNAAVQPIAAIRACSSSSSSSSSSSTSSAAQNDRRASASARHATGYDQFRQQQQQFHRHSFYEKGSAAPRGDDSRRDGERGSDNNTTGGEETSSSSSSSFASSTKRVKDERVYGQGSATAQQRREVRQQWEKSFFGRLHFEDGMHSRFAQALASEEEEAYRQSIDGQTHAQLFPRWPEDEEAPLAEFKRLRPSLQLRYIVNRLSMGERRIRYAVDYGSLSMMYQLNLGEMMVREAETLLLELGWMNDDVATQIEEVKMYAEKVKYDFDLD